MVRGKLATFCVLVVAACGTDKVGSNSSEGTLAFGVTAINAGANAKRRHLPVVADAAAPHTIDPATYPVHIFVSGPPDEMIVTLRKIEAMGPSGPQLLFGTPDGSGPGVDIQLTNGPVDLAAVGLTLNAIPTGHYTRALVWVSRSVKLRGCLDGLFSAQGAVAGTYNGQTYTTDTLTAGTHGFCTIASKSLVNALPSTSTPIGSDADYEAQTTGELTEFDIGGSSPTTAGGGPPATAQEVRDASATFPLTTDFDVGADAPTKLTLVVDLNRLLHFWPNIGVIAGAPNFQPPEPQGYPSGTSYFYISNFTQALAIFAGDPGSIEGYQLTSEVCGAWFGNGGNCVAGSPPDWLVKEWMTLVRNSDGTIAAGNIQSDDMSAVLYGDVVPTGVVAGATPATFTLPIGLYRDTIVTNGTLDGFRFKSVGDPEDSCEASPLHGGPVNGRGPFPLWYTRRL